MALKIGNKMAKADIELAIKSIAGRGASLDKDIQLTGLSILAHIEQHKEVSLFQKLYAALPKGSRTNAMVAWALAFGAIEVNLDKATKKERPFLYVKGKATDLAGATEKPWFDFKKPAAPDVEFNVEAAFLKFMEGIQKRIAKGELDNTNPLVAGLVSNANIAKDRLVKAAATVTPVVQAEPTPGTPVAADAE